MALAVLASGLFWSSGTCIAAEASDTAAPPDTANAAWSLHFQSTGVWQGYPGFHSPFQGPE